MKLEIKPKVSRMPAPLAAKLDQLGVTQCLFGVSHRPLANVYSTSDFDVTRKPSFGPSGLQVAQKFIGSSGKVFFWESGYVGQFSHEDLLPLDSFGNQGG